MRIIIVWLKFLVCYFLYYSGLLGVILRFFTSKSRGCVFVVVNYHRFVHNYDNVIEKHPSVTHLISDFKREIKFLKSYFDIVSLDTAVDKLKNQESFYRPAVCITVDDGYKDNYDLLFPVLKNENIMATIFLSTGVIGTENMNWYDGLANTILRAPGQSFCIKGFLNGKTFQMDSIQAKRVAYVEIVEALKEMNIYQRQRYLKNIEIDLGTCKENIRFMLNWDEVRVMKEAGISFGAHTHTHPILTKMPLEEAKKDIYQSKQRIEQELGVKVNHFAYPNGRETDFNDHLEQFCREIGFLSISTCEHGKNHSKEDVWKLKRVGSESPIPLFAFNILKAFLKKSQ